MAEYEKDTLLTTVEQMRALGRERKVLDTEVSNLVQEQEAIESHLIVIKSKRADLTNRIAILGTQILQLAKGV